MFIVALYMAPQAAARPKADTTPPETEITSGPSGTTTSASASFRLGSSERRSYFECRLDGRGWRRCGSPKSYSLLATGPHDFEVRAIDRAGNADPTPARRSWTIESTLPTTEPTADTTPAETTITSGTITSDSASFAFAASEPGSTFECRLDSANWAPCTSPRGYSALAAGTHTFEVRATDQAGNTDPTPARRSFTAESAGISDPCPLFDWSPPSWPGSCLLYTSPSPRDRS